MPATMNVNYLTVVHKKSVGISIAFPDVCKTPTPAGPVPIPYPNIALSAQASKTTKKVKVDGEGVMVKESNFSMSSGDEPGTLFGIISNKVKGKAEFLNYSFDVKFENKAVARLLDPMGNNCGSNMNTVCPAEAQPPTIVLDMGQVGVDQAEACEKLEEKKVPDTPEAHKKAAADAGMLDEHYDAARKVCGQQKATVSFRDTNPACLPHIRNGVPSKGHDTLTKTFDASNLDADNQDLAGLVSNLDAKPPKGEMIPNPRDKLVKKNGQPLTGDYDMNDIMHANRGGRIRGDSRKENLMIKRFNRAMGAPPGPKRVMHGAQANYGDFVRGKGKHEKVVGSLFQPGIDVKKGEGLTVFDGSTKPATVYRLDTHEDVANLYRCKNTPMPEEWNMREGKHGKKFKARANRKKGI